jgi:predicted lipoprotein with Yx(FWY)xxD motif
MLSYVPDDKIAFRSTAVLARIRSVRESRMFARRGHARWSVNGARSAFDARESPPRRSEDAAGSSAAAAASLGAGDEELPEVDPVKRILIPLAAAIVVALASASLALAGGSPQKLTLRNTSLGKILVARNGRTVYQFTHDRRNKDTCVGTMDCGMVWPPLTTHGKPIAGPGVKASLLGTITLAHGVKQVTYAGHPLYMYTGDTKQAEVDYIPATSYGGTWLAINAAGKRVGG